jgi:hypothetical protein
LLSQRVERTNLLSARIIDQEGDFAFDIDLSLLLCDFLFLVRNSLWAAATAVFDHVLYTPKKCRVAMEVNLSIIRLVPFCIEKKISRITEFLDPLGIEVLPIRHSEGMVVTDVLFRQPISNFILMVVLDVAVEDLVGSINPGPASLLTPLVEISISSCGGWKPFKNKKTSQA